MNLRLSVRKALIWILVGLVIWCVRCSGQCGCTLCCHYSAEVKKWHGQPRNQRVVFHFIPTYSSWLNLVEVLFNLLQAKVLRRGVFPSKQSLVAAIIAYLQKFNKEGRSFHWKKTAETIITSVNNLTRH